MCRGGERKDGSIASAVAGPAEAQWILLLPAVEDNEPEKERSESIVESTVHVQQYLSAPVPISIILNTVPLYDCDMSTEWHWPLRTENEKEERYR